MNPVITNTMRDKLVVGANYYLDIHTPPKDELDRLIHNEIQIISGTHREQPPAGFRFARQLYRSIHIDPTKTRPSSEALWRRLKNKGDFPRVNPYVDLTNLLSLKFQVCFGLYDLDKIQGDIQVEIGTETDQFRGIRKDILHMGGKIILKDEYGPFGNPSSDSLRTSVDHTSRHILQILFFHPDDPEKEAINRETCETVSGILNPGTSHSAIF